jgi:YHS domain-containing protein
MKMTRTVLTFAAFTLTAATIAAPLAAQMPASVDVLDGVDPVVLLTTGKEVFGKQEFSVVRGSLTYLFSTAETKATFERQPAKYEIQNGGLCARMGRTATGNPSDYMVHEGKIYIFGSDECHKRFAAAPAKYLMPAPATMPDSPAAVARGRETIEKVMAAFGGAARVDALTSYVETASQLRKGPQGEVAITQKTILSFWDGVRIERTAVMPARTTASATLLTPAGAWFIAEGRAFPIAQAALPNLQQETGRQIVSLLKARGKADFQVAALGAQSVEGTQVERVRIRRGPVDVVLGIDLSSGRLHSTMFTDRNADGEVGSYTLVYSDFRNVDGLMLPFRRHALFNGAPDASQAWTVDAVLVNTVLEPGLFVAPTVGGQ